MPKPLFAYFRSFFSSGASRKPVSERFETALRLMEWGDDDTAALILRECAGEMPHAAAPHFHLGEIHRRRGENAAAKNHYQSCLAINPDDRLGAGIKLALIGALPCPPCLPAAYIEGLFDQYAESFDTCLVGNLGYTVPAEAFKAVRAAHPHAFVRILDLGCGTGLSAAPFVPYASFIEGVDLSEAMLSHAETKNIYHRLQKADIRAFLQTESADYDLILCLDVLIYTGRTEDLFGLISARLSPDGLFAFSIQSLKDGNYAIGQDHRYAHNPAYIDNCLRAAGLTTLSSNDITLRLEQRESVEGQIILCRKTAEA